MVATGQSQENEYYFSWSEKRQGIIYTFILEKRFFKIFSKSLGISLFEYQNYWVKENYTLVKEFYDWIVMATIQELFVC